MFGGRGLNAMDLTITFLNTKPRDWTNFYRDSLPRFARRWLCLCALRKAVNKNTVNILLRSEEECLEDVVSKQGS